MNFEAVKNNHNLFTKAITKITLCFLNFFFFFKYRTDVYYISFKLYQYQCERLRFMESKIIYTDKKTC